MPAFRRSLAALMTMVIAIGAAEAAGSSPASIVMEIFEEVAAGCTEGGEGETYDTNAIAKKHFEPGLATKLEASDENEGTMLGFDVLVDGQDCRVKDMKTSVAKEGADHAVARAEFLNFDEKRRIDLIMKKIGDAWKVDDIVYEHRPFSLRKELK